MSKLENFKEDFLLFIESGYIAINQTDEDSAKKLFKAAEVLDSTNSLSKIGFGYLHLHKLELKKAITIFKEVSEKEPDNEMAKTLLGISLTMMPKEFTKGEQILEETAKSKDKDIHKLAEIAIDFVDRFIKKEPTPVEGKRKK